VISVMDIDKWKKMYAIGLEVDKILNERKTEINKKINEIMSNPESCKDFLEKYLDEECAKSVIDFVIYLSSVRKPIMLRLFLENLIGMILAMETIKESASNQEVKKVIENVPKPYLLLYSLETSITSIFREIFREVI